MAVYEYACPRCGQRADVTREGETQGRLLACQACSHDEEMVPLFLIDVVQSEPDLKRLWH